MSPLGVVACKIEFEYGPNYRREKMPSDAAHQAWV